MNESNPISTNHIYDEQNYKNTAYKGWAIFCFIGILLSICIVGATQFENLLAWGVGLLYVTYDTWLLLYVATKTTKLDKHKKIEDGDKKLTSILTDKIQNNKIDTQQRVGVLVPVYNESRVVIDTIEHLLKQTKAPERIIIVNDGSTDDTRIKLAKAYCFERSTMDVGVLFNGAICTNLYVSKKHPHLCLLNKENSGKADSLNQAIRHLECDIIITVDADTLLETDAIAETVKAFEKDPKLVAGCGILRPVTQGKLGARLFGMFQYFEYIRAFLSRAAWSQSNALLLVSGAFSAYKKPALVAIGGYDSSSLVEDYELIHRMHKYSCEQGLNWRINVIESARATTDAPTTISSFIEQRKRWFAGFLRTQFKYRHMIGTAKYKEVGKLMLPIKTIDTLQPIFGLVALFLLWRFLLTDTPIATSVLLVISIKLIIDFCFHLWSLKKYHSWLGQKIPLHRWWQATVCCLTDPFFFQPLRHLSALLGWTMVLKGNVRWEPIRIQS
jgi:cellulose synthase/poly-beta-1,6-N-acetylglucosamine synthase-like glycosyltransferase